MNKREVVQYVLEGRRPPFVPWSCGFTQEVKAKLQAHYGQADLETPLQNHLVKLGSDIGFFTDLGHDRVRDVFAPARDVEGDVPLENILAFINIIQAQ